MTNRARSQRSPLPSRETQKMQGPGLEVTRWPPTTTVFPAEVREPPHVAQADGVAHAGHEEIEASLPCVPVREVPGLLLHLDYQGFGLVAGHRGLADLGRDLPISHLAVVSRHVSEHKLGSRDPGRWACDVGSSPRGQQLCDLGLL